MSCLTSLFHRDTTVNKSAKFCSKLFYTILKQMLIIEFYKKITVCPSEYCNTCKYCNEFAGSISRWTFITPKIQYTIVNYNPQRF
jgi:hypothetical protein